MAWDSEVCSGHSQRAASELSFLGAQFAWDEQFLLGRWLFSTSGKSGPSEHLRAVSKIKQLLTFLERLAWFCTSITVLEMTAL